MRAISLDLQKMTSTSATRSRGFVKRFGEVVAADGLDLDLPFGQS
jgi:hypothetical protein